MFYVKIQDISENLFIFKLAEVWMKDGWGMDDQEERMKNKKYRSLNTIASVEVNISIYFHAPIYLIE